MTIQSSQYIWSSLRFRKNLRETSSLYSQFEKITSRSGLFRRQRLENDLRVKENSISIDQSKCMTLRWGYSLLTKRKGTNKLYNCMQSSPICSPTRVNFPFNIRCSVSSKRVARRWSHFIYSSSTWFVPNIFLRVQVRALREVVLFSESSGSPPTCELKPVSSNNLWAKTCKLEFYLWSSSRRMKSGSLIAFNFNLRNVFKIHD